jgi:hypothetical protein
LSRTADMMTALGKDELLVKVLASIGIPVITSIGSKDKMVSLEETETASRQLRHGTLLVLPDTAHPIEELNIDLLFPHLVSFFTRS